MTETFPGQALSEISHHLLRGSFWILILYDVAEEIDLERLRKVLGGEPPRREPSFRHPMPEYVRFEATPVVEYPGAVTLSSGEQFSSCVKYYDYGVVCVQLQREFSAVWKDLIRMSSRWIETTEIESRSAELVRTRLKNATPALVQPYEKWLVEDYCVIHVSDAQGDLPEPPSAGQLLSARGAEIAQIVRGESEPLSETEREEALASRISYYPTDLLVTGWVAAFVYDSAANAAPTIQLLEYANTQLLQYRHYDDVLTRELKNVYQKLEQRTPLLRHWSMARQAGQLNAMRLDVTELTERSDNAIKFLSDMFYARAYRMAYGRIGVADYRNLVEQKLRTAGDLYEFMVNEFHHARAFVLEAMVVLILVIELFNLFRFGK